MATATVTPSRAIELARSGYDNIAVQRADDSPELERTMDGLGFRRVVFDTIVRYVRRTTEQKTAKDTLDSGL